MQPVTARKVSVRPVRARRVGDSGAAEAPGVPWTPAAISTAMWLDASDAATITVASGSNISQWADKSGNARHAVMASAPAQPTTGNTLGGKNAIYFNGVTSGMNFSSAFAGALSQATAYIVFKKDVNLPGADTSSGLWQFTSAAQPAHFPYTDHNIYESFGTTARKTVGNPVPLFTDAGIYAVHSRDGAFEAFLNAESLYSTATNTFGISGEQYIGTATQGGNWYQYRGLIAEMIIVEGSGAPGAEKGKIEGYLAHKWGLAANLPSGHPYKDAAPTVAA